MNLNDIIEQLDSRLADSIDKLEQSIGEIEEQQAREPILPLMSSQTETAEEIIELLEQVRGIINV